MKKSTALISFTLCLLFSNYLAKKSFAQEIWTNGAGSSNWLDGANWQSGIVPPSSSSVIVGSVLHSPPAFPTILSGQNILVDEMTIGNDAHGEVTLQGGTLSGNVGYVGRLAGGTGLVTLDGATALFAAENDLHIGSFGNAEIVIQGGATVDSNAYGYIGYHAGSTGVVSISGFGSNLDTANSLYVGRAGSGSITLEAGSLIATGGSAFLGDSASGIGNVTINGSRARWSIGGNLFVGESGKGSLLISNQGQVISGGAAYIGNQVGSTGLITVSGANTLWGAPSNLFVGVAGTGSLTITGGATVSGNNVRVANQVGSTGIVNIGADSVSAAAAPGFLNANNLLMGPGNAQVFFNHNDSNYTFTSAITGDGQVRIREGGTIFNRTSTYSGQTVVEGGTLFVENTTGSATGSSTVHVESGGTLRGNGSIAGLVTVDGTIEPGSHNYGVLTVGGLTLNSGSNTRFRLTDPFVGGDLVLNDRIDVVGDLALGGTLNTTISASGVYRLFNYGGQLSGDFQGTNHTSGRAGFFIDNAVVDTSTSGQVNLGVTSAGQLLQFWDGPNNSPSGAAQGAGGNGTWNSPNTNWTDNTGSISDTWGQSVGVFAGPSGGTVTIEGTQGFDTLQFLTGGYVLAPTGPGSGALSLNAASGGTFNIEYGLTATVNAPIVDGLGNELLVINGGTIVLNGANTYSGGTTVEGSIIEVGADSNLGASTGGITLKGGTIKLSSSFNLDSGRAISVLEAGGAINTNGFNTTISQAIAGDGDIFIKSGTGTLTLAGVNSYTGRTSIQGGTLALSGAGQIQSSEYINVGASGTFDISGTSLQANISSLSGQGSVVLGGGNLVIEEAHHSFSGNISGTGNLELTGGLLFLNGTNSYSGTTTISGGAILALDGSGQIAQSERVNVGDGSELDISTSTSGASIINLNGSGSVDLGSQNLTLNAANGLFSGSIRGAGALLTNNSGTFTLSGSNIYSGGTTITGGTLIASNASALGSGAITNNATLALNFATDGALNMQITGTGDLNKNGSGKASLTHASSSLDGDITVSAGTLSFEQTGGFSAGTYITALGGSTDISSSAQLNLTGAFTQSAGAELHVDLGGTNPSIIAGSTTIAGDLFIDGFAVTPPNKASDLAAANYTVIRTTSGISGSFSEIDFGGAESNFDYLTLAGRIDGNDYKVGLGLTWETGVILSDGTFTVSAGNAFEVDVALANQLASATGWDGTTLTKDGAGTLILSEANAYTGQTHIKQGSLIVGNAALSPAKVTGDIQIDPTAILSGTGTITGDVNNKGTIAALNAVNGYAAVGTSNLTVGNLSHTGVIQLAGTTVGNTLTVVGNMTGNGGSIHINTVLDGDGSATDRLVIDGGDVSGSSNLIVTNKGGQGEQTTRGILVVDAINGATTNANAFILSPASSAYRVGDNSLAIGAYDYSLIRGGNGGQAESWYLTSLFDASQIPNIRPEAGAYLANRDAAESMFIHAMRDRLDGYRTTFDSATGEKTQRAAWVRLYGSKKTIYFAAESLRSKVDTTAIQAGLDLLKWSTASQGQFRTGIFVGKGDASGETVHRHDGSNPASNKVDGYAIGLYGTWFQHDDPLGGVYVDSWVQRGWYDNTLAGTGLPKEAYHSSVWSASLESGYSVPLSTTGKYGWAFDPFAQIIYTHYKADEHQESGGTLVRSGNSSQLASRIAGRLHNESRTAQGHIIGGFVEASLWHNSHTNQLFMNDDVVSSSTPKNIGELKLGLKNAAGKNMIFSFDVSAQYGSQSYRQFAGQVGLRYNW